MTREINIRLNANCAKAVHTGHKFVSGDKGIVFRIAVESMDTVGTTAKIVFKRSNGTSVEADITEENGIYCYTTLGNEFAVVGPVTADVKFYEGEKRLSTCTFVFDVISDTMDGIGAGTGGYSDTLERMKESMEQTESEMLEVKRDMEAYAEAFLGACPFNPCGAYSETESYTVRDMVTHNDVAWVCYKDCTGATPAMDSDCWMPLAIMVVDAETLDGHGAEYFALAEELDGTKIISESILETAIAVENGFYNFAINPNYAHGDLPNTAYAYGSATIIKKSANRICVIVWGTQTGTTLLPILNYYNGTSWSGWKELFTAAGGTITGKDAFPLLLKSMSGGTVLTKHINANGVVLGSLGFSGVDNPVVKTSDGNTNYTILHTGNKPTGTYTGNGSAEQRNVATGGIGSVAMVYSSVGYAFLTTNGALIITSTGNVSFTTDAYFDSGNIVSKTSNEVVNGSGTRRYQVL